MDALDAWLKEKEAAGKTGAEAPSFMNTMGNYMGAHMLNKTGLNQLGVEGRNPMMEKFSQQMMQPYGQSLNVQGNPNQGQSNIAQLIKLFGGM